MRQLGIDLPAWLESLVMKALEKDPARRYQSAEEMRTTLRQARERLFAVRKPRPFRRALVPGAVAVVLAGLAVAVYALRKPPPPLAEKSPPETPSGTLQLSGAPAGARVLLDGAPFDASRPVAAGRHHLRIEADGFKALDRDVTVAHGATVKVALAMRKRPAAPARPEKLAAPAADAAPAETRIPESQPEAEAAAARLMAEAKALEAEGQFTPAIAKLEQALAQGPTGPARGRILGKLGVLNQLTGAIPAAIKYFQLYRPYCAPDKLGELDGLIRRLQASEGMAPR
jgi:tetratricopeptide (TPR) repeat protein